MVDRIVQGYQLLEELGRGTYGCLFLGQNIATCTYVAVKILCKKGLDSNQLRLQQIEVDIQSKLNHPNLLALHHVIHEEDYAFMIMELCDQGDLFEYLINNSFYVHNEVIIKQAFNQILEGVEYMHQSHVYHRDLKLENILLQSANNNNTQFTCKVADFGLATEDSYSLEFGCGSTTYLGPEHFDDVSQQEEVEYEPYNTAASDVWALGILLLALLFHRNPWQEATTVDMAFTEFKSNPNALKVLFPELSLECMVFLRSILSLDPNDRPTVSEMKSRFKLVDKLFDDPTKETHSVSKSEKASYDSAIFSENGSSWSDLGEVDETSVRPHIDCRIINRFDVDDMDMFIHNQEKESWWL
ncbi:kinase-like domain-containing protein [Pilobolus umbonatus]|nr:kinase-like domain-containing protein [Pilobolus umbonatus]